MKQTNNELLERAARAEQQLSELRSADESRRKTFSALLGARMSGVRQLAETFNWTEIAFKLGELSQAARENSLLFEIENLAKKNSELKSDIGRLKHPGNGLHSIFPPEVTA